MYRKTYTTAVDINAHKTLISLAICSVRNPDWRSSLLLINEVILRDNDREQSWICDKNHYDNITCQYSGLMDNIVALSGA